MGAESRVVYRASELGGCTKYLLLKRLGYEMMEPPEEFKQKYFEAGNEAEEEVIARLEEGGEYVLMKQHEVEIAVAPGLVVQGHIDGILAGRVCEIKSMSNGEFEKFRAARWFTPGLVQRYKWQISVYMVGTGFEAMVLVYNRDTGEMLREGIEVPWYGIDEIRERVLDVECRVETNQIPAKCDTVNYPCGFYYMHEDEEVEVEWEVDDALGDDAGRLFSLREQERTARNASDTVRKSLLSVLDGRDHIRAGGWRIVVTDTNTRRFNSDKARADGVDVDKYMETKKSKRIDIEAEEADDGSGPEEGEGS